LRGQSRALYRRAVPLLVVAVVVAGVVAALLTAPQTRGLWRPSHSSASRSGASAAPVGPTSASAVPNEAQRLEACVDATMSKLTLEERVGQLLMVGTPVSGPQAISDIVDRYRLGGVFLAGRSSQPAATLRQAIRNIQQRAAAGGTLPFQVALDQEGGLVQTLTGPDFPVIPSAVVQGRWDATTLRTQTTQSAQRLADVGVTMDLAPVADTVPAGTAGANPPIGALDRQYGSTPDDVARSVSIVVSAAQSTPILTTLKHFPGLGRVRANTDTSTGAVDSVTTADDPFLKPFASGIEAGSGAVMISSARYPRLDPDSVAAFSAPIVSGLLRQRLGYSGLIMSDDLGAAVAVGSVPVGDRAVRFVRAGGDMVLTVRQGDAGPMADALLVQARASSAFEARVADAAGHVVRSKYRVGLLTCPVG
jgi:beta-N-acetylhexosaminidase